MRPKTGLKDMVAELNPGTSEAGELPEGERIPASQTLPDVNLDEVLASLDADTRDYLKLLLGDASIGLKGNGRELAQTIRRFEPTARYARRVNEQLALGGRTSSESIHNLSLLMEELGSRDDAGRQLRRELERGVRGAGEPERQPPGDAAGAALDARRVAEGAGQRRPDGLASWGRRSRTCGRPRARSGRRCARRARS